MPKFVARLRRRSNLLLFCCCSLNIQLATCQSTNVEIHNKITKGVYELGSVFKTLTLAAGFQNNIIEPETKFEKLEKKILEIKKFCKNIKKEFFLANDVNLTNKLNLDGAYIPAFNNSLSVYKLKNKNMTLLGSAHNLKEINQKKRQGIDIIFIAPTFKVNKSNNFFESSTKLHELQEKSGSIFKLRNGGSS